MCQGQTSTGKLEYICQMIAIFQEAKSDEVGYRCEGKNERLCSDVWCIAITDNIWGKPGDSSLPTGFPAMIQS